MFSDPRNAFADIFAGCYVRIQNEVLLVLSISGLVLTVARGQGGTAPAPHPDNSLVQVLQYTIIPAGLAATVTSVTVELATDLSGLLVGVYLQVGQEIMLVSAIAGNTLTVSRGQRGTLDSAHVAGSALVVVRGTRLDSSNVLQVTRAQKGSVAAYHADGATVSTLNPLADNGSSGALSVFGGTLQSWTQSTGVAVLKVGLTLFQC